ncbi:MAG: NAD-dependent epimerase/dehydratase family protein [Actinomycetota bacterium]
MTASRTAFVTGGTGLVGGALVDALLRDGVEVIALARTPQGARGLAGSGAEVVRGDIGEADRWGLRVADCDAIFHVGLPRLVPPVRGRHLRKAEREARAGAEIIGRLAAGRPVVMASCAIAGAQGPLAIARPALAAEAALRDDGLRVVRLPWAYGPSGFICDISRGLQMRRFRIVGPADNVIALVGARDAARALVAAASAPPGTYVVAEPNPPTQAELVHHICAARNAPRPDHLPPRMAGVSMGSVVVEAIATEQHVAVAPPPGFAPAQRWDRDLAEALAGQ